MRKVDHEQGSQAWLDWRKNFLTATDAAMLLGASPYTTPFKGWQRKVGQAPEQFVNQAMLRGNREEPKAREMFIQQYGLEMNPCCIESEKHTFLGASLDGISSCGQYLLEIKSTRHSDSIPDFHICQMQHQMLCTDGLAKKCYYVTIWENEIQVKEVMADENWMKDYVPKALDFWKKVVLFDPPAMTNKDYKDMNGGIWQSYATEYRKACDQIKALEEVKDSYKKELIKMCGEDSCFGNGIKVMKKITKGRVDYDLIDELAGVNLEKYRKPTTFSWTIMIDNAK